MRNVKAILIDPFTCTVSQVEHDADKYTGIYDLLSHETMPVDCFTILNIDHGDAIYVDDNGMLKPCERFFIWRGYPQPLAGKGLVLGSDEEGDTIAASSTLDHIRKNVIFAERVPDGLMRTTTPWQPPTQH